MSNPETSPDPNDIAWRNLLATMPTGEKKAITLRIGKPYQRPTGEWACPIDLEGLFPSPIRDARGEDAFQALMLAQQLARVLLKNIIEKGGALTAPDFGEESVDIDKLFGIG